MTPLTFTLKTVPPQRVDLSNLVPHLLTHLSLTDIAALPLPCGNRTLRVDNLFEITGTNPETLLFYNTCNTLDSIGNNMQGGIIRVHGEVGAYLGQNMKGGEISVFGNSGVYVAAGMSGGELYIHGNAGSFLAAARPGETMGLRGGRVIVTGQAGDRVGDKMRRGMVLVEGNVGDYCGTRMIAGTIAVFGQAGHYTGFGMHRGTLLLSQPPIHLPVTFNECGQYDLLFLRLLAQVLYYSNSPKRTFLSRPVHRFVGDMACQGKGELLILGAVKPT